MRTILSQTIARPSAPFGRARRSLLAAALALLLAWGFTCAPLRAASVMWTSGAGDDLWSSSANWSNGLLPSDNDVTFTNTGASIDPSAVTSIVNAAYSINSLTFNNTSGNSQSLFLQTGGSLNINSALNVTSGGTASFGSAGQGTVAVPTALIFNGALNVNSGATLAVTNLLGIGEGGSGTLNLAPGAGLHVGTAANPIELNVGVLSGGVPGLGVFAPNSATNPNIALYLSSLYVGYQLSSGTVNLSNYTGPLAISDLEIGGGGQASGVFTFGNGTLSTLNVPTALVYNGALNVNSGATLAVTSLLGIGEGGSGTLNLAPGAGLHVGTAANPIELNVGVLSGGLPGLGVFAPNSATNPNIALYLSSLYVGYQLSSGTVNLSNYTGPLAISDLEIGGGGQASGVFTFGNGTLSTLNVPTALVYNGALNVNSGATLAVTSLLGIGEGGSGTLNLAPGAGLHVGTAANPIELNVGVLSGGVPGLGVFAPNSATNPNIALYLSSLYVGYDHSSGTVNLSNYTGPLAISDLEIGGGGQASGVFTFGNGTLSTLNVPTALVYNGALNVNSGATLAVTSLLGIGEGGSGTLNLAPGAGLHVGTAANPIELNVGVLSGGLPGLGVFAPNSATNPNIALYLSSLYVGYQLSSGTVNLSNYTGPLAISDLEIGGGAQATGTFTFGNGTLSAPTVDIHTGALNVNSGATLAVTNRFDIGDGGSGTLNLALGAGLHVGTPASPVDFYVGLGSGSGVLALNSATNPNIALYLSELDIGERYSSGSVDLSNYTGPLAISDLEIGGGGQASGVFTFGNGTLSTLNVPTALVYNGALNVNSGATLAVTNRFDIGDGGSGTLNLAPGAGLHVGTSASPVDFYVGLGSGSGVLALNSATNPNIALYLSELDIGDRYSSGSVDLSNYTGPLAISDLEIGGGAQATGTFTFGNGTLSTLTVPTVNIYNGVVNLNGGLFSAVYEYLGESGTGNFTQSGGTNAVSGVLLLAQNPGSSGTYNLNGGLLMLSSAGMTEGGGTATFNFNGGTLGATEPWSTTMNLNLATSGITATIDTTGGNIGLSGILSGPGALNKVGPGTLALTASNTYTGGTTISGGNLQLGDGATANGYVAGNILDNATLAFNPVAPQTFSGTISGSGALAKLGIAALTLTASNTFTGGVTLGGGTLAIDFSQPGAPPAVSQSFNGLTVNPGGTAIVLLKSASNSLVLNLGTITRNQGGTVDFTLPDGTQSAANGITTTTTNTNGILGGYATVSRTDWAASTGSAGNVTAYSGYTNGDLGILSSNGTLNVEPTGPQTSVTSAKSFNSLNLTGTEGVAMSGSGSLTLFSGGLIANTSGTITGGTLAGSLSGELVVITPHDLTIASAINAGVLTKAGTGKLTLLAANNNAATTLVGNGVLLLSNANAAQNTTINVAVNNGLQFAGGIGSFNVGSIAGGGALALTDTGGGAVTVSAGGNNASTTYSGAIGGGGTLVHGGSGTLTLGGQNTFTGGLVLESNATVFTSAASPGEGSVSFDGSSTIEVTGNMTIPNSFVSESGATGTIDTGPYTVTLSGTISGPGGMNKLGAGTAILTNSNSLSGATDVNQGALQLANSAAMLNSTAGLNSPGTLQFSTSFGSYTLGGLSGGGSFSLTDTSGTGAVNLTVGGNNQNTTFGGTISGGGTLTKAGSGSLDLTGTSPMWTGGLVIDPGVVAFTSDAALGAPANQITFLGSGTLHALGSMALSASRSITINSGGTAAFDPQGNTLTIGGAISGGGTLAVTGSGLLVLSNTNSYSGGTFVNVGVLEATSSAALAGAFTPGKVRVAGGASLVLAVGGPQEWTASGVNLLLSVSGLFQPGSSFGLDTSGGSFDIGSINPRGLALAIAADNTLDIGSNANSTYSGQITGAGSLTKIGAGSLVLSGSNNFTGGTNVADGTLMLMAGSALLDGTSLSVGNAAMFSGNQATIVPLSEGTCIATMAEPVSVPEPSAICLLAACVFAAIRKGRYQAQPRRGPQR